MDDLVNSLAALIHGDKGDDGSFGDAEAKARDWIANAALAAPVDADVEELAKRLCDTADMGVPDFTNSKLLREAATMLRRLSRENAALREGVATVRASLRERQAVYEREIELDAAWGIKEALATIDVFLAQHFPKPEGER